MLDNLNTVVEDLTNYLLAGGAVLAGVSSGMVALLGMTGHAQDIGPPVFLLAFGVLMCCPAMIQHLNGNF